nr:MAG TPA: hypothetical protein [Caudoviricetes sp.]
MLKDLSFKTIFKISSFIALLLLSLYYCYLYCNAKVINIFRLI